MKDVRYHMRFVEDISRFYGTGERNKAGQTLEEYLDGYDPRQFDLPSNTTDIIVVRCKDELKSWNQELEVLLIKRGNHPGIGFWATPGGFVEMRENMDEGAARELEEETGYRSEHIEWLVDINSWPAFTNEKVEIYVAKDLIPSKQKFDEEESIELEEYTLDELKQKIFTGEIMDSKTVAGILAYAVKYE